MKVLASNKKAYFNFDILDQVEAGILLEGWEVKSIKSGRISLDGAYVKEKNGEFYILQSNVPKYKFSTNGAVMDEHRDRKLLMHKKQIVNLHSKSKQEGATIVPLEVIQNDKGLVKVTVALVKGRKSFDKRAKLKERDQKRRIEQDRKKYNI